MFPELALTTFFPRWWMEDEAELDTFYETEVPNRAVAPLFELGRKLEVGFYLGYAELTREGNRKRRFNTSILVDPAGHIAGKYRKVHLPGHANHEPDWPFQHLEKGLLRAPGISVFRSSMPSAAGSACASATTGDGRRPTG